MSFKDGQTAPFGPSGQGCAGPLKLSPESVENLQHCLGKCWDFFPPLERIKVKEKKVFVVVVSRGLKGSVTWAFSRWFQKVNHICYHFSCCLARGVIITQSNEGIVVMSRLSNYTWCQLFIMTSESLRGWISQKCHISSQNQNNIIYVFICLLFSMVIHMNVIKK